MLVGQVTVRVHEQRHGKAGRHYDVCMSESLQGHKLGFVLMGMISWFFLYEEHVWLHAFSS